MNTAFYTYTDLLLRIARLHARLYHLSGKHDQKKHAPGGKKKFTGLAGTMSKTAPDGESIGLLWTEEDRNAQIADAFDLDTVTDGMVKSAQKQIYERTQESLKDRGFGDTIEVYRAGKIHGDIVNVSSNKGTAERFGKTRGVAVDSFIVKRSDVLVDTKAVLGGGSSFPLEQELVTKSESLVKT